MSMFCDPTPNFTPQMIRDLVKKARGDMITACDRTVFLLPKPDRLALYHAVMATILLSAATQKAEDDNTDLKTAMLALHRDILKRAMEMHDERQHAGI